MSGSIPLGKKEDRRLEFKGADALKDPEKIAREVVAMLNAEGGEVWVGLREDGGRAVAVEPIAAPEIEERRLLDFLVDAIEPSVSNREIGVRSVEGEEGTVLRVAVTPDGNRKPYAFLKRGGRHFVIRIENRTRPMSREEIMSTDLKSNSTYAKEKVFEEKESILKSGRGRFWLRLQPEREIELDLRKWQQHLYDPALTGNRRGGWNFVNSDRAPLLSGETLVTGPEISRKVEIRRSGGLVFEVPLEGLSLGRKGQEREVWPLALLEFIVSAFRLARVIYSEHLSPGDKIITDLVISGLRGWILRGGTPNRTPALSTPHEYDQSDDFVREDSLVFDFEEISTNPDWCGYRWVRQVYGAFDFGEDAIPSWFDRASRRLVIPE